MSIEQFISGSILSAQLAIVAIPSIILISFTIAGIICLPDWIKNLMKDRARKRRWKEYDKIFEERKYGDGNL